ncbi:hydantoinase/oxoprolinase family protein [Nonomuraea lactucae]|uniref:hydantoinase/oxoprolinase family protein n=1 Tax=Nonomuraea lactucae TaxID=2249762 RepID=UPI000DE20BBE|nr:hydantoinase/oxoprolinase family protein [Nonomuraea lactucae]
MPYRIGLDVGGTNTDAVLMSGDSIVAWNKRPTSADVSSGIVAAVADLLKEAQVPAGSVGAVMIGTTHFTNAVVERRRLGKVLAVRICLPANTAIPVAFDWPRELAEAMRLETAMIHGGANFDGKPIASVLPDEIADLARRVEESACDAVALTAAFAPVSAEAEVAVQKQLHSLLPDLEISMSHEIGRIGLLERENATILNASLLKLARETFAGFVQALEELKVTAPLYISQNDGTVVSAEHARSYPIRTLSSGPTNSMRGAAFLSGCDNAIVLDVGGTTTDAGAIVAGFPREAPTEHSISGVRTNFRMPEVASVGVGGGSTVTTADGVRVGPQSVGYAISREALVFGGRTVTATDVAVAAGLADVGDRDAAAGLDPRLVEEAVTAWHQVIEELLEDTRSSRAHVPVILVGGGSIIVDPERINGFAEFVRPDYFQVANAVGAAIPQVSAEIDRILVITPETRAESLDALRNEAMALAVSNGAAAATVTIADEDILNVPSLSDHASRVRIRALGTLEVHA